MSGSYDGIHDVTASAETLMRQGPMTVEVYFHAIIEMLDGCFGENYAKEHPDLVGSLVASAAQDFHTANIRIAAQDLRNALHTLADAIPTAEASVT
jgi:hypothetical protein